MANNKEKKGILKKLIGVSGASIAKGVSDTAGAGKLTDYVGSKIAKMRAPSNQKKYVEDKTSGKDALKSLGKVALTVAPMGAAVGALRMVTKIGKINKLQAAIRRSQSAIKGGTKESGMAEYMWKFKGSRPGDVRKILDGKG